MSLFCYTVFHGCLKSVRKLPKSTQKCRKSSKIDPKISKKCVSYCKNPTHEKKRGTCPQKPTAGPKTYLAPRA